MQSTRTTQQDKASVDPSNVAVICVNWNGWRDTLKCLASLRNSRGACWHLIIVDNASSDESLTQLSDLGDDVTLIAASTNSGWSGGNNLGIRHAMDTGYHLYLLLNNDATVEPDTLRTLIDFKGAQQAGPILGALQLDGKGEEIDFLSATLDPLTGYPIWTNVKQQDIMNLPTTVDTCFIKGAAILIDRVHVDTVGFFDDRFYLNFDETDWCFRAKDAGFALKMVTSARVHHMGSASIGGMSSALQVYFLTRNSLLFGQKHCTPRQRIRYLRNLYWQARELQLVANWSSSTWILRIFLARHGVDAAFKRGILDYLLGRFGDCPPIIRKWNGMRRNSQLG